MKRFLFVALILVLGFSAKAQNVQLHYDFGGALYNKEFDGRPQLTTTVEMFKPDAWGSTFFFVDMDYTSKGVDAAYWEIARELKFWDAPFSAHVEYNGGISRFMAKNEFLFNNAYLLGATYTYNNANFSRGFSVTASYKYIQKHSSPNNFQLTGTWYMHMKEGMFTFNGFADWWREKNLYGDFIFIAEPQIWFNLNKLKCVNDKFNLSVGSELEMSYNFAGRDGFYAIPTLAVKWSFD